MHNNNQLTITGVAYTEMDCLEPEGIMQQEEQYLRSANTPMNPFALEYCSQELLGHSHTQTQSV